MLEGVTHRTQNHLHGSMGGPTACRSMHAPSFAARSCCKVLVAPSMVPAATDVSAAFTDPLLLDGCTIKTTWKKGRKLVGRVVFTADASKPRSLESRGRTKYRIFFEGRKPDGVRVSWNRLKRRQYEVVGSTRELRQRAAWTDAEMQALKRRHRSAHESQRSLALGLGRTRQSIENRLSLLNNPNVAPLAGGRPKSLDKSINWREVVSSALEQLEGGRGTQHSICSQVEQSVRLTEHHRRIAPGNQTPIWKKMVTSTLSANTEFEKTGQKERGFDGLGRPRSVWQYHPRLAPPAQQCASGEQRDSGSRERPEDVRKAIDAALRERIRKVAAAFAEYR